MLILTMVLWLSPMSSEQQSVTTVDPTDHVFDGCRIDNKTFLPGEEIVYQIKYQWNLLKLNAGEAVFRVRETDDHYHIVVEGRTYGAFEWFYKVNDRFETFIDKESLLPEMFIRDVEEGKYRKFNKFIFDQNRGKIVSYVGRTQDVAERKEVEVARCMHDMLSILYHVRNMDFSRIEAGESFPVQVFLEKEYPLSVRLVNKYEEKRIRRHGKFMTHVFSPQVIESHIFKETDQMKVYVSTDDNKLPLLIESPLSVGKMQAVLKSYKGLRFDLDSGIE